MHAIIKVLVEFHRYKKHKVLEQKKIIIKRERCTFTFLNLVTTMQAADIPSIQHTQQRILIQCEIIIGECTN